jgi:hypothetical protein
VGNEERGRKLAERADGIAAAIWEKFPDAVSINGPVCAVYRVGFPDGRTQDVRFDNARLSSRGARTDQEGTTE